MFAPLFNLLQQNKLYNRCKRLSWGPAHGAAVALTDLFVEVAFPPHVLVVGLGQAGKMPTDGRCQFGAFKQAHGYPEVSRESRPIGLAVSHPGRGWIKSTYGDRQEFREAWITRTVQRARHLPRPLPDRSIPGKSETYCPEEKAPII